MTSVVIFLLVIILLLEIQYISCYTIYFRKNIVKILYKPNQQTFYGQGLLSMSGDVMIKHIMKRFASIKKVGTGDA